MAAISAPFLGIGLLRPFQRDQKNDFANTAAGDAASAIALVRSCVGQVLGTRAQNDGGTIQGEVPWRQAFGSKLYMLKHRKGAVLNEMARIYVTDALRRWEPRVQLLLVEASFDDSERVLTINLRYNVIAKNVPGNNVLFANVDQTVALPLAA